MREVSGRGGWGREGEPKRVGQYHLIRRCRRQRVRRGQEQEQEDEEDDERQQ